MGIVQKLKNLKKWALETMPLSNVILFESAPVYTDNTKGVFEEMVRRGLHKKYKFIWLHQGKDTPPEGIDHVKFVKYPPENWFQEQYQTWLRYSARALISCNDILTKIRDDQYAFFLMHGAALKRVKGHYVVPNEHLNEILSFSQYLAPLEEACMGCDPEKMRVLGFPRNDILLTSQLDVHKLFPDREFTKLIYWMPTFRQHKNGSVCSTSIALPIIYNEAIAMEINEAAKAAGVLVVLKPHFAQDVSRLMNIDLSNLVLINDAFLAKNKVMNYELLGKADAMLTDYSSVYHDFLLTDRPIGLCWDDYEEFAKNEGFVVDVDKVLAAGEKLYTADDLCGFIQRLAAGEDALRAERTAVRNMIHDYQDANSGRRVVDHILEQLEASEKKEVQK